MAASRVTAETTIARALAVESGLSVPAVDCAAEAMRAGVAEGLGEQDFSIMGRLP